MNVVEFAGRMIDLDTGEVVSNGVVTKETPLIDTTASGRERPWNAKKLMSLETSELMNEAAPAIEHSLTRKAERMKTCADILTFHKTDEGRLKLNQTYFCKVRLCPMCNWRRSLKMSAENAKVVEEANRQKKLRWLFLTLTVENCTGDKLNETINAMSKAFKRMTDYKRIDDQVVGWFRALEITKNNKKNTFHPHYHMLICVEPRYFVEKGRYIKQKEWTSLWQQALNVDYTPVVHIEAVKARKTKRTLTEVLTDVETGINEAHAMQKAVLEVSKYTVKDSDVLKGSRKQNLETIYWLDDAITRKRLVAYGGLLKKIHKALNLADDGEEENLIHVDGDNHDEISAEIQKVTARWSIGLNQYIIS